MYEITKVLHNGKVEQSVRIWDRQRALTVAAKWADQNRIIKTVEIRKLP